MLLRYSLGEEKAAARLEAAVNAALDDGYRTVRPAQSAGPNPGRTRPPPPAAGRRLELLSAACVRRATSCLRG